MVRLAPLPRICLTGPESTGKTELAQQLAAAYATVWVPEFAREYALRIAPRELTEDDVEPIARGAIANEERWTPHARRILLLDTDLISTVVYARHYYGHCPLWIEEEARRRRARLYLLLDVDVEWRPDPARDAAHDRAGLFTKFRNALDELGVRYETIRGEWRERRAAAKAAIDAVLG